MGLGVALPNRIIVHIVTSHFGISLYQIQPYQRPIGSSKTLTQSVSESKLSDRCFFSLRVCVCVCFFLVHPRKMKSDSIKGLKR